MKIYRKLWEATYGEIPVDENGRTYEIHHIDGNHSNNSIENLQCLSIEEHFKIHLEQEDWQAAASVAKRMFLDNSQLNKLGGLIAKKNKQGIHGLSEEQRKINSSKGGKKIKGYFRWNDGKNETSSPVCPGEEWKKGGLPKKEPNIKVGTKLGSFWNNGSINKRSIDCPGNGWVKGKLLNEFQRKRRKEIASRKMSEETKIKISKANKNKPRPKTETTKTKISQSKKGIPWSIARRNAQK